MEIHKGTVATVDFFLPTPDTTITSLKYSFNYGTLTTLPVTMSSDKGTATLPYFNTEGRLDLEWAISVPGSGAFTNRETHEVVTPILTIREVKDIMGDITDAEAKAIESGARHIISAHTGQTFGLFSGVNSVTGSGENYLRMPVRLLKLITVNGYNYMLPNLTIRGDGWYLKHIYFGVPPLKADFHGLHYLNNGIIEAPPMIPRLTWLSNVEYEIEGEWGWYQIPEAVKEAARLLIEDYSCEDANYRDRYLSSISAADWKIQFNSGAYARTGNVRADQLLADYVLKRGWAVI